MTKNIIRIHQVSSVEDIISMSPINCHITHNVALIIGEGAVDALLTPNREGLGHGWDTLVDDLRECLEIAHDREEIPMGEGILTVWR